MRILGTILSIALLTHATAWANGSDQFEFFGFEEQGYSQAAIDGMAEIYSGRLFLSGVPKALLEEMGKAAQEHAANNPMPDLGYDPRTQVGKFYSQGELPSPPNREVPEGTSIGASFMERNGAAIVGGNCFACHTGQVKGMVVAGLGNNGEMPRYGSAEGGPRMSDFIDKLNNDAEKAEAAIFASSQSIRTPTMPEVKSRGDHYGPFAVWGLGARLADPANQGLAISEEETELFKLFRSTVVPPVDPMPWWTMKYKERDYWYSDGAPDDAAHFSFNFTTTHPDSNDYHTSHVESTAKALAFARETVSPPYPEKLDPKLVRRGANIFHGRRQPQSANGFKKCSNCHGSYERNPNAKDYSVAGGWFVNYSHSDKLKDVGTDSAYNDVLRTFRPIARHIDKLVEYYEKKGTPELAPTESYPDENGYVAPPLVGVWASAPYFHNGSVPTIEAVLNSELRPEIWARSTNPFDYDLGSVGLVHEAMTRDEYVTSMQVASNAHPQTAAAIDFAYTYDTTQFGRSNGGHTFGDQLTDDERAAVIEFLKSLSGPDM